MRIDALPIWAVFAGTIVVVMVAIEAGYLLGQAMHRRSDEEKESPVSAIAGAILGLAAFMLAFTFGIVSERHDYKKALVREDAVAIRTAWQRSDFLPEPDRAEAKTLLRHYVDMRVTFAEEGTLEPARVKSVLAEMQRIQDRLWDMAVANARQDMNSDVAALYIESLNVVNGVHASRVAVGIQARVPNEIWLALYCVTILGMTSVGYQTGIAGSKRSMARPILALSFALVFTLIASLDRPDSGVIKVTQQPLIDLRDSMAAGADFHSWHQLRYPRASTVGFSAHRSNGCCDAVCCDAVGEALRREERTIWHDHGVRPERSDPAGSIYDLTEDRLKLLDVRVSAALGCVMRLGVGSHEPFDSRPP